MLDKKYNPRDIEQFLYEYWDTHGYFKPHGDTTKSNYCIMMPPPNITGSLHMGHAFQHTLMDILIRYHRMQGKNTLWKIGTDHAGIATHMIIERKIAMEEGKTRHDYGRDKFVNKTWQWQIKSKKNITQQIRRLGHSVDWTDERFTMDEGFSHAVKEVFVSLYKEGLIYRKKSLVNWDIQLQTVVSDLEIKNRELKGYMWYLRYPIADGIRTVHGLDYLIVATTRPETMFGDTAISINPEDSRYNNLIGNFVNLPIINRRIPIIGDLHIDITQGSGCVKITPAHDFNDYIVGKKNKLPMINIFTTDGCIRDKAEIFDTNGIINNLSFDIPKVYRGLDRYIARQKIITTLKELNLIEKIQPYNYMVPYGDRSGVIIEPMLTDQWYLRTTSLAKVAIDAVKSGDIKFIPQIYENTYFSWMNNIQDWCISRQLWWGHRIPAWYDINGQIYVGHDESEIRCQNHFLLKDMTLKQDEDVLDTWFSSALWTFTALGWPRDTSVLHTFHPIDVLVSGFDIIFFWIARMIMLTMHFIKNENGKPQIPFKVIYITGLIRDEEGKKMSKSKGNVIDPLDMIDGISLPDLLKKRTTNIVPYHINKKIYKFTQQQFPDGIKAHGADALRFTLSALASTGRDINWDMQRLNGYHNFCNKLWNASRFVIIHTEMQDCGFCGGDLKLSLVDRWIIIELNETIKIFRESLDNYRFALATNIIYEFIWNKFCDWFLEASKLILNCGNQEELRGTRHTLVNVLEILLRLAHPIIPFITETIWKHIKTIAGISGDTIMLQPFPLYNDVLTDHNVIQDMTWIKKFVTIIRAVRTEMKIRSNQYIKVMLRNVAPDILNLVNKNLIFILGIAKLNTISIVSNNTIVPSIIKFIHCTEILIPITEIFDKESELTRISKEIIYIDNNINYITKKLNNLEFVNIAPQSIIMKEKERLKNLQQNRIKLIQQKYDITEMINKS